MPNASNFAYFEAWRAWRARLAAGPGARGVGRGSRGGRRGVPAASAGGREAGSAGGRDDVSSGRVSRDGVRPAHSVDGDVRVGRGEGVHAGRGTLARAGITPSQLARVDRAGRETRVDPQSETRPLVRIQLTAFP